MTVGAYKISGDLTSDGKLWYGLITITFPDGRTIERISDPFASAAEVDPWLQRECNAAAKVVEINEVARGNKHLGTKAFKAPDEEVH